MSLKTSCIAVTAACCAALTLAGTSTAAPRPKPANTRVTIRTWPKGLFGYVSSPRYGRCAAGRLVTVFVQRGARQNRQRDRRIASVRARGSRYAYQWSIRTNRRARFYARVANKQGCRNTSSPSIVQSFSSTSEGEATGFPVCSPYVEEDQSTICRFEEMRLSLKHTFSPCVIGDDDDCSGIATSGPYPWGQYGRDGLGPGRDARQIKLEWHWGPGKRDARMLFVAYNPNSDTGIAHLGGTLAAPNSAAFTVSDGFAVDDDFGYPVGEHFFTPDIPGQDPGQVGGPLHLNFINGTTTENAVVYIEGYLFLK